MLKNKIKSWENIQIGIELPLILTKSYIFGSFEDYKENQVVGEIFLFWNDYL
jgi:hypothetical protein